MYKLFIDSAIKEVNAWSLCVVILFVFELVRMSCWLSSLEIHKKVGQTCSKNSSPTLSWVFFFAGVVTGHNLMENMSLSEIYDFSLKNPMETGRTRTVLVLFVTLFYNSDDVYYTYCVENCFYWVSILSDSIDEMVKFSYLCLSHIFRSP